jgi:tetratricopeptide (TPR) repeat protein
VDQSPNRPVESPLPRRSLGAAAMLALAAISTGCATSAPTARVDVARPDGIDQYAAGTQQLRDGNEDAAIASLQKAIAANPNLRMARKTLGELLMKRKDYAGALPHLEKSVELDPYTVSNHYNLGLALQVLDRLGDSVQSYLRALKLEPEDFASNMNLGLVYFSLNKLEDSSTRLEKATRIDATNPRGWSNLGVVHDARGNAVIAETCYRKSLELDPDNDATLQNLTVNLIAQKKPVDAIEVSKRLVDRKDSAAAWKRYGDALALAKKWNDAMKAYDTSFARDPSYAPAINGKAEAYLAQYRADLEMDDSLRQLALATWKQSLTINKDQPAVQDAIRRWSSVTAVDPR